MNVQNILIERKSTHGEYRDHAQMAQALKRIMYCGKNWEGLSDIQKESLQMFAHKIGRILVGDPNHRDHWDDISGYAVLVADRLGEDKVRESPQSPVGHLGLPATISTAISPAVPFTLPKVKKNELNKPGTPEDGGHHSRQEG